MLVDNYSVLITVKIFKCYLNEMNAESVMWNTVYGGPIVPSMKSAP